MKQILLGTTALVAVTLFASLPVVAADMPAPVVKAPAAVAAPLFNWSGFYGGVFVGRDWGKFVTDQDDVGRPKGWIAGGLAGVNYQAGNIVVGLEGDIGMGRTKGGADGGVIDGADIRAMANARLRLGIAADRLLLFIAGGPSWLNANMDHSSSTPHGKAWVRGWTAGLGIDWAASDNGVLRLEYLYGKYSERTFHFPSGSSHTHDIRFGPIHTVRAALIWRFASGKYPIGKAAAAPVVTKY
jgi:outer membrane immunogenic protein